MDLIRAGVSPRDLKAGSNKAVWRALVRTAVAHQNAGRDQMEWDHFVLHPASKLGHQVRLRDGHKVRKRLDVQKSLDTAWEEAWEWRTQQAPAWTKDEAAQAAKNRAALVLGLVADADADLTDAERAVLDHAAREASRRGITRPTLPREPMLATTGLGLTALRTALGRLEGKGLLTLAERGRRGPNSTKANVYALADAEAVDRFLCRETRPVVPPGQTCSAPTPNRVPRPGDRHADDRDPHPHRRGGGRRARPAEQEATGSEHARPGPGGRRAPLSPGRAVRPPASGFFAENPSVWHGPDPPSNRGSAGASCRPTRVPAARAHNTQSERLPSSGTKANPGALRC